jgi:hypothetical protein
MKKKISTLFFLEKEKIVKTGSKTKPVYQMKLTKQDEMALHLL